MAKVRVGKLEAATRQINSAIRMHFDGGDPISVHTLAAAGLRVLRDLGERNGASFFRDEIARLGGPDEQKEFYAKLNRAANFFKHADKDAGDELELDELFNDAVIVLSIFCYQDLAKELSVEMLAMMAWFHALHPEFINENVAPDLHARALAKAKLRGMTRADQIKWGKTLIKLSRRVIT